MPVRRHEDQAERTPRWRIAVAFALLSVGLLLLLFLYARRGTASKAPSEDDLFAQSSPRKRLPVSGQTPGPGPLEAPPKSAPEDPSADPEELWERRLERAQRTLDNYLLTTRYPFNSRPLEEQPDQVHPHFVSDQTVRLTRRDDKLTDARVTLHQDRYYVVGDETVTFAIACENSDGPAPCEVLASFPRGEGPGADASAQSSGIIVPFTSEGAGALTATFQPRTQGFAEFYGPIRLFIDLRVDGETGQTAFEVMFTPRAPAIFTGSFREVLEDGSLDLHAELKVDKPGRYVIAARAEDDAGRSFAYLSFNEELGAGLKEARLRLFGKLIRDQKAKSPFHLRDIEGFLLKENTFPDRELMPSLTGVVHTTKRYEERDFSDQDWQSEEKDRHVKEFTKDVEEAKRHVVDGG
jgi:hypothetical protein